MAEPRCSTSDLAPVCQKHAERLTRVEEQGGSGRTLKEFFYDTSGFAGAYVNGKLTVAVRHNWVQVPWAPLGTIIDAAVTEKLTFNGRDGRPSERVTSVAVGAGLQWRQSWSRDDLGNAATITYPICENATCTGTAGAALARTITNLYTNGFLTIIREGTTNHGALTYHPNRLVASIIHSNGVTERQANDPNQVRRPASISSTAMASVYGPYKFDGAGNISDIGQHQFVDDKASWITEYEFASSHGHLSATQSSRAAGLRR